MIAAKAIQVRGGVPMRRRPFCGFILLGVLALGCRTTPSLPGGVLAQVDGRAITVFEFAQRFEAAARLATVQPPAEPETVVSVRKAFLEQLIDEALLESDAALRGIELDRETIEAEIRTMYAGWPMASFKKAAGDPANLYQQVRLSLLATRVADTLAADAPAPNEAELQAYFAEHPDEFRLPEQVHLRQVVCADRSHATMALTDLLTGGEFVDVARRESIAPEAARGGDLGFIVRGELLPTIEESAFTLPVGEISTLIETPFGVHIVQVLERLPGATLTFPQARPTIERALERRRAADRWRDYRQSLRDRAAIVVEWSRLPG